MKPDAFQKLRCSACLGPLTVEVFAETDKDGQSFVESGLVLCDRCRVKYPIESGTPVMLRFRTSFHDWFSRNHSRRLQSFARYSLPSGSPRPGELDVQETFTDEWNLTRESDLSFTYTFDGLVELNRQVWLRSIVDLSPERKPRTLLNIGCGVGMETMALREATGAEELFGIDLNFALLSRREEYRQLPDVSFVIASLFDLPFESESFDFVYSQGVLHHTYSTSEGFKAIAPRVAPDGRLFIWVYGLEDHLAPPHRAWKRRHWIAEQIARPPISRSPRPVRNAMFKALVAGSYARAKARGGSTDVGMRRHGERWSPENTEHALRDWLSPRYAHRHGFNEVMGWFESHGFEIEDIQSPTAYQRLFEDPLWGVGMTGRRIEGLSFKGPSLTAEPAEMA